MSAVGSSLHTQQLSADIQYAIKRAHDKGASEKDIVTALERIGQDKRNSADLYRYLWHRSADHCAVIRNMWHKDICSLVVDPEELDEALARVSDLETSIADLERQNREYHEQRRREELQHDQQVREQQQGWRKQLNALRQRCVTWLPLRRPAC